ncbi:hypothetical protein, partial [Parafrankia sp. BMG5.11]|uniref:hypothetical protein n=1 Tax=Parafrankia sp. BMG5.11 TaxID=222540 RepID=UPI001A9E29FA
MCDLHKWTSADVHEQASDDLLSRGFGVQVPGGAPVSPGQGAFHKINYLDSFEIVPHFANSRERIFRALPSWP